MSASLEFSTPAQDQGNATVLAGQWALVVFNGSQNTSFRFSFPNGAQTNSSYLEFYSLLPSKGELFFAPLPSTTTTLGSVDGTVHFEAPKSYLFVRADFISLTVPGATLGLDVASAGDWAGSRLRRVADYPSGTFPPTLPRDFYFEDDQVALAVQPDSTGPPSQLTLRAEGLRFLSWQDAAVSCRSASCPEGGAMWTQGMQGTITAERRSAIHLAVPDGILEGLGEPLLAAVGGHALHVESDGALRFPEARLQGTCGSQACPDPQGRTLLANGNVTLDHLSVSAPNRLHATMSGDTGATFDETPGWSLTVPEKVGVGLAVVLAAVLVKALVGLFSHPLTPEKALDHPRRRRLYAAICQHPGSTYRFLMEAADLSDGVTRHHLKALVRTGLIVARGHGKAIHYFENHGRYDRTWKPVTALRDPALRQLYDWMAAHPGSQQKNILENARSQWQWSPAAARKRLLRLEAWGLIAAEQRGRQRYYRTLPQDQGAVGEGAETD